MENCFSSGKSKEEMEIFFQQKRKGKTLGIFGTPKEKIKSIELRLKPLGLFTFKKGSRSDEQRIFVDLHSAEIYSLRGAELHFNPLLKKILDLPPNIGEEFLYLMEHKISDFDHFPKKHLSILEKKRLIYITGRQKKDFLILLIDHLLDIIRRVFESSHSESEMVSKVMINFQPLNPNRSHDLDFYLERDKIRQVSQKFEPDEINYQPKEIENILQHFFSSEGQLEFKEIVYLPYYQCHYGDLTPREVLFFPLKFKSFTSHFAEMSHWGIHNFIDKAPEIPFLFVAFLYLAYIYPNLEQIAFIFSNSFIFVFLALLIGFSLKLTFKKERKVPYLTGSLMRYGFPSLHSLTSLGTASFVFFIPDLGPFLALFSLPLGFLYVYSRLKLQVHSLTDVVGGGIIGLILGALCGYFLLFLKIFSLSSTPELLFTLLFFILPVFSILYRVKVGYLS